MSSRTMGVPDSLTFWSGRVADSYVVRSIVRSSAVAPPPGMDTETLAVLAAVSYDRTWAGSHPWASSRTYTHVLDWEVDILQFFFFLWIWNGIRRGVDLIWGAVILWRMGVGMPPSFFFSRYRTIIRFRLIGDGTSCAGNLPFRKRYGASESTENRKHHGDEDIGFLLLTTASRSLASLVLLSGTFPALCADDVRSASASLAAVLSNLVKSIELSLPSELRLLSDKLTLSSGLKFFCSCAKFQALNRRSPRAFFRETFGQRSREATRDASNLLHSETELSDERLLAAPMAARRPMEPRLDIV